MYLSKLEILGFKSFANKTNIVLNDGITAIVGPNGCGKTNIVDALRWALGEQRYSTLRSDKMEDVIFNGTKTRKAINVAEVSLTIQNNKGVLPLEYNEVTITRRVFRSGDSDYLLNRTPCRLKDIVTLFMDTGMGSNAYSVIELKMVETILSDKVEERRRLFEEASGVTKYKARRKEALRRLSEVESDLIRVDDIISEVTKTVNALHRQAKKAERYNGYLERLRHLEVDVLERDYANLLQRLEPLQGKLLLAVGERDAKQLQVEQEEALLQDHRNDERAIEARLAIARDAHADILARAGEADQHVRVNEERKRGLLESIERFRERKSAAIERLAELEQSTLTATAQMAEMQQRLQLQEAEIVLLQDAHQVLELEVSQKRLASQARQSSLLTGVQELTQARAELASIDERLPALFTTLAGLAEEDVEAQAGKDAMTANLAKETDGHSALSETVLGAEREFHAKEELKSSLRAEIDQLQNKSFELQGRIGERMTKIDFLTGLVDRLEGYSESVQHLLRNRDWAAARYGTIADAVNTRDELRVAVEAALGDAAHYILVNDIAEAVSGLQNLKNTRKGKATFACLSRIPVSKAVPFSVAGDGIVGWAADLVRYEAQHHAMFQFLLKNVLIVRDANVAHACTREYAGIRCVTLDGDLFSSDGIIRGGSHGQEEGGLIGKKDQIAQLNKAVLELKERLEENQRLIEDKTFDYDGIDLKLYAERIKQTQLALSAQERRTAQLLFEIEKFDRILQKNAIDRARLERERNEIEALRTELAPRVEEMAERTRAIEEDIERENAVLVDLEQRYNGSNEGVHRASLELAEQRASIQNIRNELDRIEHSSKETRRVIEQAEIEIAHAQANGVVLEEEIGRYRLLAEQLDRERGEAEGRQRDIENELAGKKNDVLQVEELLQEGRQKHTQSIAVVHEIELKVTEITQRIEALVQIAADEFELELQPKVGVEEDVFDLAQAREEIRDLREKLKTLGPVNPLAFEEWKKESERLELLTTQRRDLAESQETLTATIQEINQTAKEKFTTTFALIRDHFIKIFKSLFDEGDEADLILEEGEDPLEARIDITAKPRGKRPHSIDMLSGGEKTLTAIALLFAIYLVKPSPFCILDEVDAPLDDANIDRFVRIIRKFSDNTQFIVVTHNKRTMAAADTLYGVTMEEEGVSKLVAVNFNTDNLSRFSNN